MDPSNHDAMPPGMRTLTEILQRALDMRVDCVRLEYDRGDLELYYVAGATGIGSVVDRETGRQLIETIEKHSRRGQMKIKLGETELLVAVREYENFEEPAFELQIKPPKKRAGGTSRRSRRTI